MKEDENELDENKSSEPVKNKIQDQKDDDGSKKTIVAKIWSVVKKNPFSSLLLIALIICFTWYNVKMNIDKNQFEKDKSGLISNYEQKIDSLKLKSLEFSASVFSWSVRSELIRKNIENLNQLFNFYVKESNANLVQLVNLDNNKLIISTDKQFEGNSFLVPKNINLTKQSTVTSGSKTTIYTPVMGLNKELGLLIVAFSKEK